MSSRKSRFSFINSSCETVEHSFHGRKALEDFRDILGAVSLMNNDGKLKIGGKLELLLKNLPLQTSPLSLIASITRRMKVVEADFAYGTGFRKLCKLMKF